MAAALTKKDLLEALATERVATKKDLLEALATERVATKKDLLEALAAERATSKNDLAEAVATLAEQFTQILDARFVEERSYIDARFIEERSYIDARFVEERAPTRQMVQAELLEFKASIDRLEAKINQVFTAEGEDIQAVTRRLNTLRVQFRALEVDVAKLQSA